MITSSPYSAIATIYDGMMEHVDYAAWADYIERIFAFHHKHVSTICELACGTGSLAIELARKGFVLHCSDLSPDMVRLATEKQIKAGVLIDFSVHDMSTFSSEQPFDVVICLYDSLNYLLDTDALRKFFRNAEKLVVCGGLLIFDICTEHNSLKHFENRYEFDRTYKYRRKSYYLPTQRLQVNEVSVTQRGNIVREKHEQRIYRITEVAEIVEESPFETLGIYEDLGFQPGTEASERVHFVLEKPMGPMT